MHVNGQKCYVKEQTLARRLSKKMSVDHRMSKEGRFGKAHLRPNIEQKEFLRGKSITQTTNGKILQDIVHYNCLSR